MRPIDTVTAGRASGASGSRTMAERGGVARGWGATTVTAGLEPSDVGRASAVGGAAAPVGASRAGAGRGAVVGTAWLVAVRAGGWGLPGWRTVVARGGVSSASRTGGVCRSTGAAATVRDAVSGCRAPSRGGGSITGGSSRGPGDSAGTTGVAGRAAAGTSPARSTSVASPTAPVVSGSKRARGLRRQRAAAVGGREAGAAQREGGEEVRHAHSAR